MTQVGSSAELKGAPEADDARKSGVWRELSKPAWRLVYRRTIHGFMAHGLADMAGSLTYFGLLAIAPSLVAIMSLASMFGQGKRSANALLATVSDVAPSSAITMLKAPIEQFSDSPTVGYAFVVSALLSIWATSSYVAAFGRSLNRIYEVDEGRPIWKLKPWPVMVLAVVLIVAILYFATPNVEQPKFRWMSVGAFMSVAVLTAISLLFAFYVRDFAHYDRTYRSFAGIIFVLLWLWLCNLTLLFGAEFDAQFERARQLQAGIHAENSIQLPPRETEASERAARNRREDVREGRAIRRAHTDSRTSPKDGK